MTTLVPYPGRSSSGASAGVPLARGGRVCIAREWWPVVIVPGIMGSRLERADGSARIWDPDSNMFMVSLMIRSANTRTTMFNPALTPGRTMQTFSDEDNGNSDASTDEASFGLSRTERNWTSVSWAHYGDCAAGVQAQVGPRGGVVFCFGYDWRLSNIENGLKLKEFIENVVRPHTRFKPIVVTHSMGGLVTRAACSVHGMESMVTGVIHTMMPTHGAAEAYGSPKLGDMDFPFSWLVGDTYDEIACVTSGVGGMFQLMPSGAYPDPAWLTTDSRLDAHCIPAGPFSRSDPYAMYREASGLLGLVNHERYNAGVVNIGANTYVNNTRRVLRTILANINEAERYHARDVAGYCHPRTWLLAGREQETVVGVNVGYRREEAYGVALNPTQVTTLTHGQDGDATVPLVSARALEHHANCQGGYTVPGIVHSTGCNEPVVINAVVDMINASRAALTERW
ncbi:MAG: lipase family alpha/beta hydrolase [Phycisphaerales bacterium]